MCPVYCQRFRNNRCAICLEPRMSQQPDTANLNGHARRGTQTTTVNELLGQNGHGYWCLNSTSCEVIILRARKAMVYSWFVCGYGRGLLKEFRYRRNHHLHHPSLHLVFGVSLEGEDVGGMSGSSIQPMAGRAVGSIFFVVGCRHET